MSGLAGRKFDGTCRAARVGAIKEAGRGPAQHPIRRRFVLVAAYTIATINFGGIADSAPVESDGNPAIGYRRVFVPAERVDTWPRHGDKYLPLEGSEFDRLIAAANQDEVDERSQASLRTANYYARFAGQRLRDCRATWEIDLEGNGPVLLPLGDLSTLMRNPVWLGETTVPVRHGLWGGSGAAATSAALQVPHSGTLEFEWSSSCRKTDEGYAFLLRLPSATITRLTIDLPLGMRPVVDHGVIVESSGRRQMRRWILALGPPIDTTIGIVDDRAKKQSEEPTSTLREEISYQITERGLDILATYDIDIPNATGHSLAVPLPAGVRLIDASCDGTPLKWEIIREDSSGNSALVTIPARKNRRSARLVLRAWQAIDLDAAWSLPNLRPADVFWTAGSVYLSISPQLELRALNLVDCRRKAVATAAYTEDGVETWTLECFAPTAKTELIVGRRHVELEARIGTTLNVGESGITGRSFAQLVVDRGSIHTLVANTHPDWLVEAVDTIPADILDSWVVTDEPVGQRLELRLARSLRADEQLSVAVNGRLRRADPLEALPVPALQMLRWRDAITRRDLLQIETSESYAVASTSGIPDVEDWELAGDDRALFEHAGEATTYDVEEAGAEAVVRLTFQRGNYSSEVLVDAACVGNRLLAMYETTCRPLRGPVEEILIHSTESLGPDAEWKLVGSDGIITAARVTTNEPRLTHVPDGGELWRLRFHRPIVKPVVVRASTDRPMTRRTRLPLLSLPDASDQTGRVLIRSASGDLPVIELQALTATSLPRDVNSAHERADRSRVFAAYRYDPAHWQGDAAHPQLWISPPDSATVTRDRIAVQVTLESFYAADGHGTHRATYQIENNSDSDVEFQLPMGAAIFRVAVDGFRVAASTAGSSNTTRVPLSIDKRRAIVELEFQSQQTALRNGGRLRPLLPATDIPLLTGEWIVVVPQEFRLIASSSMKDRENLNWWQVLVGPFGRSLGTPFDALLESTNPSATSVRKSVATELSAVPTVPSEVGLAPAGDVNELSLDGWHTYRTAFVVESPAALAVVRPATIRVWSLAALLVGLFAGSRLRGRRVAFIVGASLVAAIGLLLPAPYPPVAGGAFLGFLLSLFVQPRRPTVTSIRSTVAGRRLVATGTSAVSLCLAVALAAILQAEERTVSTIEQHLQDNATSETTRSPDITDIERVLIPIDGQGQIVGSKYFVSERLLGKLVARDEFDGSVNSDWLVSGAKLSGQLIVAADRSNIVPGKWSLTLPLDVFSRDTTVVLPLSRADADWPTTISLDGIPVPLACDHAQGECTFEVREPGRYDATLAFVPRTRLVGSQRRIELAVPRINGARVSIARPTGHTDLAIEGTNNIDLDNGSELVAGTLDGSGRFGVVWTSPIGPSPSVTGPRVSELRWLRVEESGVILTTKYMIEESARTAETLTVLVDEQWRVLSPVVQMISELDDPEGADRFVRVPLSEAETADGPRREAMLRLELTDARVVGQLRLRRLELASQAPATYRLAVSAGSDYECQVLGTGAWAPGDVQDFIANWGDASEEEAPQLLLAEVSPRALLNVAVRPRAEESNVTEVLHVAATQDGLKLQYQADVDPNNLHRFQYTIDISPSAIIDDILVSRGGEPAALRWVRVAENRVNVFFEDEILEPYRLVLVGRVPRRDDGRYPLPRVTAISNEATARELQLYRDESVLVEVKGLAGPLQDNDQQADLPPVAWNARWLGGYRFNDKAAQLTRLTISPNELTLAGESLVSLEHDQDGWRTTFTCHVTVERGVLASLRLRVPATWANSYKIESTTTVETSTEPLGKDALLLTARLGKSVAPGDSLDLKIRAPLVLITSAPVAVPEIAIATPGTWQSFVSVPARVDGRLLSWSRVGVNAAKLPEALRPQQSDARIGQTFRVISVPYQVALQAQPDVAPQAGIRLADTLVVASDEGSITSARFIIASQGLAQCTLQLPEGEELVDVRLDGNPALMHPIDARQWRLRLGPPSLPQVLEVTSRQSLPESDGRRLRLARPTLLAGDRPIPVELSLWSAARPGAERQAEVSAPGLSTALDQAALRLDRLVSIAEAALPIAIELDTTDGSGWFQPWTVRVRAARDECLRLLATGTAGRSAQQVSASATDQISACEERIDALLAKGCQSWPNVDTEVWSSIASTPMAGFDASSLPREGFEWLHLVAAGGADQLVIDLAATHATPEQVRIFGLLAIAAAAAGSIWLTRRPAACDLFWRWPHAVGVLIGLAYWAWLAPSWFGCVIIAGSLLLMFRPGWEGRVVR